MTHIITGPAGSGKTAALYELLKNDSKSRILLVPDQFVFESERRVAKETDEKTSDIKVMGFMSLSESILKKHCPQKTYADTTAKTAIMSGAVRGRKHFILPKKTRLNGCLSILPRRWAILRRYTAFMIKS